MKTKLFPTSQVESLSRKIFSNSIAQKTRVTIIAILLCSCVVILPTEAQFSKPVVVLKGTVCSEKTGKPFPAKISIRCYENKALELTFSQSNSISGNYLVVLHPRQKYWVYLEGENVIYKEELIETPPVTGMTVQMCKDFSVIPAPDKNISEEKPVTKNSGAKAGK